MCIVIDNCQAMDIKNNHEDMEPVVRYLKKGGIIVLSDKLYKEYPSSFQSTIVELQRRNQVRRVSPPALDKAVKAIVTSNDHHVIALVREARVEVVCTADNRLTDDLKNPRIVSNPRCRVYRHKSAKRILSGCCP